MMKYQCSALLPISQSISQSVLWCKCHKMYAKGKPNAMICYKSNSSQKRLIRSILRDEKYDIFEYYLNNSNDKRFSSYHFTPEQVSFLLNLAKGMEYATND